MKSLLFYMIVVGFGVLLNGTCFVQAGDAVPEKRQTLLLDEVLQAGEMDWSFDNGREFKGAKGSLILLKDEPEAGRNGMRLAGDFTGGGAYVQAVRKLPELAGSTLDSLVLTLRSTNCTKFTVRMTDSTGQCHQQKIATLVADGQWHEVVLDPLKIAGGEHWGGANDGQWHGSPSMVAVILNKSQTLSPVLDIARPRAITKAVSLVEAACYKEGFEAGRMPEKWESVGTVMLTDVQPFSGNGALQLVRTLENVNQPIHARGPVFTARPGAWEVAGAGRSALYSPDESFQGVIAVEWLDAAGKMLERSLAQELRGTNVWKPFKKTLEAPAGTVAGRLGVELEKTYGAMAVDELSVSFVPPAAGAAKQFDRVMLSPSRLGGMFLPDEMPTYKVSVWALKPLKKEDLTVTASISDYWGAEQGVSQIVTLQKTAFKQQVFQYEGELVLSTNGLEVGRFYRLHLDVPQPGAKPFRHTIGLARLPEALTKQYSPEEIPFTIRNWDNRIKDYFFLTDRIGIRVPGVWGGWSDKPPYKPNLPGGEWCQKLGMKWVTGSPGAGVERGKVMDPVMLKTGMTNFLKTYATNGLAYICLGNEPSGGPSQITSNIAAYKVLYEAVKAFDPKIQVIATSVEPNEEYFRQGYQNYCDIYDFHTYESYPGIRKTVEAYKALMEKYHAVKPIFSTELGLNCQGLSRQIVAQEMVKKFAVFFAAGGVNASWFTIMYPDPKGTEANSSGQAFNIYDTRYNQYNPKLDAVTLYQAINAIANKAFKMERTYADGTESYLFANSKGECLQMVWNEKGRTDIGLAVPGAETASLVLLDGTTLPLAPHEGVVTVTVSAEPIMVLYRAKTPTLQDKGAVPSVALEAPPTSVVKGQKRELKLFGAGLTPESVRVTVPPKWQVTNRTAGPDEVVCEVMPPAETEAQSGRITIGRVVSGKTVAALVVDMPVDSSFAGSLKPALGDALGSKAVQISLVNHSQEPVTLHWQAVIGHELNMAKASYRLTDPQPAQAGFGEAADGTANLAAGETKTFRLPLRDIAPLTLYHVTLRVNDDNGHESMVSRYVAGFMAVHKGTPVMDGDLSKACWAKAPVATIDQPEQFYGFKGAKWNGPDDVSAKVRFLWDEQYLYLGVQVTDNIFVSSKADGDLWNQDGLQFLVDPRRQGGEKMGYYDGCLGLGTKGPQLWYNSTASPEVMTGEVKDAKVMVKRGAGGNADYEVAIPWSRLAPFKPVPGADLGMGLIVNDDDGAGRSFAGWFSGVHLKETDMVGDLILTE
ncbi:MAG: sugar-binding protein [bacterium]